MKYYYNMIETYSHPNDEYWTREQVEKISICSEDEFPADEENGDWWPVYNECFSCSWEPVECKNKKEAYEHLFQLLNKDVFEYVNDL